jgi:hypothetical protein
VAELNYLYIMQGKTVALNVRFTDPQTGMYAIADLVVSNPAFPLPEPQLVIEVKTGQAQLSKNQTHIYNIVRSNDGIVVPSGLNALAAGFVPGVAADLGPLTVSEERFPSVDDCTP